MTAQRSRDPEAPVRDELPYALLAEVFWAPLRAAIRAHVIRELAEQDRRALFSDMRRKPRPR